MVVRAIRRRPELALFAAGYLLYTAARWIFAGHLAEAREHADWILDLERSAHVAIEGSIQRALDSDAPSWLLSNVYLAAQLVVLPGALVWLYRRSRPVYRQLRTTVIATWLIAVPVFALFPVAPPRLAGIGIADTVSSQAALALTGHSTVCAAAAAMPMANAKLRPRGPAHRRGARGRPDGARSHPGRRAGRSVNP
jgi:hypothetical protein